MGALRWEGNVTGIDCNVVLNIMGVVLRVVLVVAGSIVVVSLLGAAVKCGGRR